MTRERWQQIDAVYRLALQQEPDQRGAFLAEACRADNELRREVESLLAQSASLLSRPAWQTAQGPAGDPTRTMVTPGAQLGPYRIEALLGSGGMGQVFRATDTRLGRAVAIKTSLQHFSERFEREARAISALNHPHLCTLYDIGATPSGTSYLVMELVEGESLAERLKRGKSSCSEVLAYGTQIGDALAAAHAKGIIHRDLKPHNIMLASNGVKVLDFGLAKSAQDATLTASRAVMGTPAYMAPELFEGREADARSDIYALGLVLYEMATGKRVVPGGIPDMSVLPPPLASVIGRCLARDPGERWQAAGDVARELESLGKTGTLAAAGSRRFRLWIGVAVLALAAGFAAWRFWPGILRGTSPRIASIAVLPLQNLSGDPSQEFLSDGATDELISTLGQLHLFEKVISHTSVMRYKNATRSIPEIGRELGVDAILEGSIQRSGGRVRIRARLIEAATDGELWARDYDRAGNDVLGLEAEVASAIAQELRTQIAPAERTRLAINRNIAPAAQEQYLLGRYHVQRLNETDLSQAVEAFTRATRLQPGYAAAYAGLARTWIERAIWGASGFRASQAPAMEAVLKALELDPNLSEAHTALGLIKCNFEWDWAGSEREFQRAIELDPNSLEARDYYGGAFLMALGRFPEAIAESDRAVELDPLSSEIRSNHARVLFRARKYQEAIPQYQRAIELDSQNYAAYTRLAELYERLGRYDKALALVQQALTMRGAAYVKSADIGRLYARLGRRADALRIANELSASPPLAGGSGAPAIARIYFALGDKDRGFQWLTKAFDDKDLVIFARFDPNYDDVRSDPRFQALVARLKIPDPR